MTDSRSVWVPVGFREARQPASFGVSAAGVHRCRIGRGLEQDSCSLCGCGQIVLWLLPGQGLWARVFAIVTVSLADTTGRNDFLFFSVGIDEANQQFW